MSILDGLRMSGAIAPIMAPWLALAMLLAVVLRAWQPFRKMNLEREAGEVARLTVRVVELEAKIERMEADAIVRRHELQNERAIVDALLMLLETAPDKIGQGIAIIKQRREADARNIAIEKGELIGGRGGRPEA